MDAYIRKRVSPDKIKNIYEFVEDRVDDKYYCSRCPVTNSKPRNKKKWQRKWIWLMDMGNYFRTHHASKYMVTHSRLFKLKPDDIMHAYTVRLPKYITGVSLKVHCVLQIIVSDMMLIGYEKSKPYMYDPITNVWKQSTMGEVVDMLKLAMLYITEVMDEEPVEITRLSMAFVFCNTKVFTTILNDPDMGASTHIYVMPKTKAKSAEPAMLFMRELFQRNDYCYWQFRYLMYSLYANRLIHIGVFMANPPEAIIWLMRQMIGFKTSCVVKFKSIATKSTAFIMNTRNHKALHFLHTKPKTYPGYVKGTHLVLTDCREMKDAIFDSLSLSKHKNADIDVKAYDKADGILYSVKAHHIHLISDAHYRTLSYFKQSHWGNVDYLKNSPCFIRFAPEIKILKDYKIDEDLVQSIYLWALQFADDIRAIIASTGKHILFKHQTVDPIIGSLHRTFCKTNKFDDTFIFSNMLACYGKAIGDTDEYEAVIKVADPTAIVEPPIYDTDGDSDG